VSKQPQWAVSGVVEASVEKVWESLIDVTPGLTAIDKEMIAYHNEAQPFTITVGKPLEGRMKIEVDRNLHSVAIEGEWWYRGVHTVKSHPKGSLVTYEVYNIAPSPTRWMAQLVQGPQHARTMKYQLQQVLDAIGKRLHSTTYLIS
jgi:hypothetical protein